MSFIFIPFALKKLLAVKNDESFVLYFPLFLLHSLLAIFICLFLQFSLLIPTAMLSFLSSLKDKLFLKSFGVTLQTVFLLERLENNMIGLISKSYSSQTIHSISV